MLGSTNDENIVPIKKRRFIQIDCGKHVSYDTYLRKKITSDSASDSFKERVCWYSRKVCKCFYRMSILSRDNQKF